MCSNISGRDNGTAIGGPDARNVRVAKVQSSNDEKRTTFEFRPDGKSVGAEQAKLKEKETIWRKLGFGVVDHGYAPAPSLRLA